MNYRFRKQLFIIILFLVVIAAIATAFYFLKIRKAATCFDGIQNQNEKDVDCGGICALSCELLTIKPIEISWAKFISLENESYDLVASINNPNPNFGVSNLKYTFKIYDVSGNKSKGRSNPSYILANGHKYVIEGGVDVGQAVGKVELTIETVAQKDWSRINEEYRAPNIYVMNREFSMMSNPPGASQITGLIKNDSTFDFNSIDVSVLLFDSDKKIIGVNKTEARTVLAGEQRYFSTIWFSPIDKDAISSVDIQAETNILSDENFMSRYGKPEKFQEYMPTSTQ